MSHTRVDVAGQKKKTLLNTRHRRLSILPSRTPSIEDCRVDEKKKVLSNTSSDGMVTAQNMNTTTGTAVTTSTTLKISPKRGAMDLGILS